MMARLEEVQIELAGICNAACAYCDWQQRTAGKQLMDADLADALVTECATFPDLFVTYHGVGESTLHPQLMPILQHGELLGLRQRISTNCARLDRVFGLSQLVRTQVVMALHWGLAPNFVERCVSNALAFLEAGPKNPLVQVMLVCSDGQAQHAEELVRRFLPAVEKVPNAEIFLKQPVTWPRCAPVYGVIPNVPDHPKIKVHRQETPRSIGRGCNMPERMLEVMADGTCAPCCVGTESWGLPNAAEVGIAGVWESERMQELRRLWQAADDRVLCGHCLKRTDC